MKMPKVSTDSILSVVLILCISFIVGRSALQRWQAHESLSKVNSRDVPNWRDLTRDKRPSVGNQYARVVIVEFSDYQCPFCRKLEPQLETLVSKHSADIALYRYDFPLAEIHPYAMPAAIAAECAAMQDVTLNYQQKLFSISLAKADWVDMAKTSGVRDTNQFAQCIHDGLPATQINQDVEKGRSLQISSTPTIIVNGALVSGALNDDQLDRLFREAKSL